MEALLILVIVAALLALGYAAFNFIGVKKLDEGTDRMKEIAAAIRVGANAFITYEYKIIAVVVVIIAIAFAAIFTVQYGEFSWEPSVCFMIGVIMSASAGWVGMKIATYANVRVSNTARNTKNIGSTLKVALKGGSVMGLCVGGFALLGLFLGSSSGMCASVLPTRSAPISAALVYIPPPTRLNIATIEQPSA